MKFDGTMLPDFPNVKSNDFRQLSPRLQSAANHAAFLNGICKELMFYEQESDDRKRQNIVGRLDDNLRIYQTKINTEEFQILSFIPFYERLIMTAQKPDNLSPVDYKHNLKFRVDSTVFIDPSVWVGLGIAERERDASSGEYFNWVIQYLHSNLYNQPTLSFLKNSRIALAKMGATAKKFPDFVTQQYVDLCCSFINHSLPTPSGWVRTPQEKLQMEQAAKVERATIALHTAGYNNLSSLIIAFQKGHIDIRAEKLFSSRSFAMLEAVKQIRGERNMDHCVFSLLTNMEKLVLSPHPRRSDISAAQTPFSHKRPQP